MKVIVKISPTNMTKEVELKTGSTVYDLLKKIQLKPDTVVVIRNNMPIPVDDVINEKQEFRIVQVASGG